MAFTAHKSAVARTVPIKKQPVKSRNTCKQPKPTPGAAKIPDAQNCLIFKHLTAKRKLAWTTVYDQSVTETARNRCRGAVRAPVRININCVAGCANCNHQDFRKRRNGRFLSPP